MWTWDLGLVRHCLSDHEEVADSSKIIGCMTVDRLAMHDVSMSCNGIGNDSPNNKKVSRFRLVSIYRSSNQIIVDDLSDLSSIHITEHERLGISDVQDRWLAKVELRHMLILVILLPVIVDDGRPHPISTHDGWILL